MKRYIIERDMPGVGKLDATALRDAARVSSKALRELGPAIQWVQSFRTDDRFYCVYLAENAELIHRHAQMTGFPANRVLEAGTVIDPVTAAACTG